LFLFNDDWVFRAGPRLTQAWQKLFLKVAQQKPNAKVLFVSNKAKIASLNGVLVDYSKFSLKDGRFMVDPAYAKRAWYYFLQRKLKKQFFASPMG